MLLANFYFKDRKKTWALSLFAKKFKIKLSFEPHFQFHRKYTVDFDNSQLIHS